MNITLEENRLIHSLLVPLCWTSKKYLKDESEKSALPKVDLRPSDIKSFRAQRRKILKLIEKLDDDYEEESERKYGHI